MVVKGRVEIKGTLGRHGNKEAGFKATSADHVVAVVA